MNDIPPEAQARHNVLVRLFNGDFGNLFLGHQLQYHGTSQTTATAYLAMYPSENESEPFACFARLDPTTDFTSVQAAEQAQSYSLQPGQAHGITMQSIAEDLNVAWRNEQDLDLIVLRLAQKRVQGLNLPLALLLFSTGGASFWYPNMLPPDRLLRILKDVVRSAYLT